MAQEHIIKLENALSKSLDEIDKTYARKVQGDMHRCAARCCDNTSDSIEQVYNCVRVCSSDYEKVQGYLLSEYTNFQSRLQRCVLQCNDDITDKAGPNPSPSERAKFNREYDTCIISCANRFLEMVPPFMNKMKEVLKKKKYVSHDEDDPRSFKRPTLL